MLNRTTCITILMMQIGKGMVWSDWIWYLILCLPLVIFFYRLLLTNVIVPHFKKKSLLNQMNTRSDWPDIEKTIDLLQKLFKKNYAKISSAVFRKVHHVINRDFIYGEIDFLSFHNMLEKAKPQPKEIFYDLGSGSGKAVFAAALFFNFSKSCGIELLSPLYKKAHDLLNNAKNLSHNFQPDEICYLKQIATIEFIKDSFLNYDFSDANIIYVAASCFCDSTWEGLINKMAHLKPGTRIIVATKSIQHDKFDLIYQDIELMSWGLCPVKIYKIRDLAGKKH